MSGKSAYAKALGASLDKLAPAVRYAHAYDGAVHFTGQVNVKRGDGKLARLVGRLLGFPPPLHEAKARITFSTDGDTETLTRQYGPDSEENSWELASHIKAGDAGAMQIVERMGPVRMRLTLSVQQGKLLHEIDKLTFLGIPVPAALWPTFSATEWEEGGRYRFDVSLSVPFAGFVIRYSGWLLPA